MDQFSIVKEKADILQEFIDAGGILTRTTYGNEVMVICPFHDDKKASMSINKELKVFNCFGCSAKGDVIELYSKMKGVSIRRSLLELAHKYSINISNEIKINKSNNKDTIIQIYNEIANIGLDFMLKKNKGYTYINNRGVGIKTIKELKIGFIENSFLLFNYLKNIGFSEKKLFSTGLFNKNKEFVLADRVLFPIFNLKKEVVMFTGRSINDLTLPKYKNSVNKIINKSEALYNLQSLHGNHKYMIIVEGPMDAVALYENDKKNAVAVLGKTISRIQYNIISQMTNNVVIWLDNDKKDVITSSYKSFIGLYNRGVNVKYILLDDKLDPYDFCQKMSLSRLDKYIIDFSEYFMRTLAFVIDEKDLFFEDELQSLCNEYAQFMKKNELFDVKNYIENKYGYSLKLNRYNEIDEISLESIGFKKDNIGEDVFVKKYGELFIYLIKKRNIIRLLNFIKKTRYVNMDELEKEIIINDNQVIVDNDSLAELKSYIGILEEAYYDYA